MSEDLLRISHALLRSDTALAAIREFHGRTDPIAVEGLVELIYRHRTAAEAVAAMEALAASSSPIVCDALVAALASVHPSVRLAAIQGLHRQPAPRISELMERVLLQDESWPVRRAALQFLANQAAPDHWRILAAASDPHWRVRHALITVLLRWSEETDLREEIGNRLDQRSDSVLVRGVRTYLQFQWHAQVPDNAAPQESRRPASASSLWDWDAAVLLRKLEQLQERGRRDALDQMPNLLKHADERIRGVAGKCLRDWGRVEHLAAVVAILDEPRQDGFADAVKLLSELDDDRKAALALHLMQQVQTSNGRLTWALDQVGDALPADEARPYLALLWDNVSPQSASIRCAFARLCSRWRDRVTCDWMMTLLTNSEPEVQLESLRSANRRQHANIDAAVVQPLLDSADALVRAEAVTASVRQGLDHDVLHRVVADPDARVRVRLAQELAAHRDPRSRDMIGQLQADAHPHVRAAAMTAELAAELIREPRRESSWHVLACAARIARIPFWNLAPESTWRPIPARRGPAESISLGHADARPARSLGPDPLAVTPLGISGHYGLPVQGFGRAFEAGVNLMFWEPNYGTMTDFYRRVSPAVRRTIHLIAGTFEADGMRVRRDAESVLRNLKIEQIGIFLLFWVRSWERITPEVRDALERLKAEGKIAAFGLSTHSRSLAVEAIDADWNPVMVRHSAAHRGVEREVCPRAVERGTSLITFSNTCYGRLLQPRDGMAPASAADCYRYTLMQPGVRACLSAPASLAQLEENLQALRDPVLAEDRRNHLLALGEKLYEEETVFRKFVRDA